MNKHFLSFLFVLFVCVGQLSAERISQDDAALVANNFMNAGSSSAKMSSPAKRMVLKQSTAAEQPQYYIYENADGEGWVMVAANDIARPIIAYSNEGQFRTDNQPENLKHWLGSYNKQIKLAEQNGVQASDEVKQEWSALRKSSIRKATPVVAPLIKTLWDQDAPYYNQCPQKGSTRTLTGCVATAMAQVMNYWQWPETGNGSYSYSTETLGLSCSANFGATTYDWANMLDKYSQYYNEGSSSSISTSAGTTAQKNAIATLMYHCGVAAEMDYNVSSAGGSGTQTIYPNASLTTSRCAQYALINNFKYKSSTVKGYYRPGGYGYSAVNDATWHNLLKTELDAGRPIMYAGADNEGGHSFVCDGYDNTTPTRKYHFNWGWSGYCNGYYDVDALVPGTGGSGAGNGSYNDDQDIIVGIIPDKPNITITWSVQGSTSTTTQTSGTLVLPATTPSDCTSGKKFVGWTEQSSVTGTKPSDLFTSGSGITVTENKTYYAVYATAGSGSGSGTPTKATSIAVGDEIILVAEGASYKKEMTGFSSTSTVYGTVADYTSIPAGTYTFNVVAGNSTGTYALKHGSVYATWSSGNSLSSSSTLNDNSSWTISINDGNAIIANANTSSRTIRYNTSSPRFACYTSGQGDVQLYKMGSGTTYSDYSLTCTTCTLSGIALNTSGATTTFTVGDAFTSEGLVVTASYSDCANRTVSPTSVSTPDMSSTGTKTITVTYTEAGVTKTQTYTITVNALPTYTIRFFNNGTLIGSAQTVTSGQSATKPADPTPCEGYTFAGWWTATLATDNTTSETWITDFTATQDQDYYAVFSKTESGGGSSKTYTLELDGNNFVGSYNERSSSATANEDGGTGTFIVEFTSNGVMKSSNSGNPIQFRKSGSGAGVLYNTTDLGTINTITYGSGSTNNIATTYKGSTEQPTSDGTGGYFKITNGSSVSYITSISINFTKSAGESTTYYTTSPDCSACLNKVTITKGTPANGSFSLNKTGEQENCKAGGLVVTVSDITPATDYQFKEITQTGISAGVSIDQSAKTVTYAKDVTGSSTINVIFEHKPTYTIRFYDNGTLIGSVQEVTEGQSATKPADPTPCDGYTFAGWWTATLATDNTTSETWITDFTATQDQDYYAVFTKTESSGGGGSSNESITFSSLYSSDTDVEGTKISIGTHTSVTFTKGSSNSKYYSSGSAIRWYGGGSCVVESDAGNLTNITFTFGSSDGSNTISATGYTSPTWTGDAASVTFSQSGTSGNRRIAGISTTISGGSSSTTYYTTSPDCPTPCTSEISITKGENPEHGTFTISNSGTICIDEGNASTTVTASPNTHYHLSTVTSTSGTVGTIEGNTCTITGISANTTINVTFAADPKDVVNWYVNGTSTQEEKYAGETLSGITAPTSSDCDGSKVFMGWTATADYSDDVAPADLFSDPTTKTMPAGGTNFYAVFAESSSGGTPTAILEETFDNDLSNDATSEFADNTFTNFPTGNSKAYKGAGGTIKLGASGSAGYITSKDLDLSSAFTVSLDAKYYNTGGDNANIVITIDEGETNEQTVTIDYSELTSSFKNFSFNFSEATSASKVTIGTSTKRAYIDNVVITTGGGTSYSDYVVSCVTYDVTATTNNASYGSVSVDHYTITASPQTGYIADGYTVTSGNATVTQNGNIYTVHPTSDCTVQINFRAATEFTITLIDNGKIYTDQAYEGTPYILPEEYKSTCPDVTFLGWATGEYNDHATGTSVAPSYTAGGEEVNITAATTFVAVYGKVDLGDNYAALNAESELTSGANYVVAAYHSDDYIMKATTSEENRIDSYQTSLTLDASGNEITDSKLVWRINVLNAATKTVTFYNADINKYLSINGDNALCFDDEPFAFTYIVDESGSSTTWVFTSTTNTDYKLAFYSTYHKFNAYTTGSNLYLYKQLADNESYTSHPNCCHEPATPLAISAEPTTLIASGVTTISLEGGNNQNITWSTTGGTLSNESNTGATLTLSAPGTYTVTATQPDNETDPDNVVCGAEVSVNITVKAQYTIDFKTIDSGSESLYSSITVTEGDSYTMPNIAEDFDCGTSGKTFVGWASSSSATAVEQTAGASVTASATVTWYACWSIGSDVENVDIYEEVTDITQIASGDKVIIGSADYWLAAGAQNGNFRSVATIHQVEGHSNQTYFLAADGVKVFTLGGNATAGWSFLDDSGYLYASSSSSNNIGTRTTNDDNNGLWDITIDNSTTTIVAKGENSRKTLQHNNSSPRFTCYASASQTGVVLYRRTGNTQPVSTSSTSSVTTDNAGCTSGATIRVNSNTWITSAKGQKVKAIIDVVAKGFESAQTLTATSSNDKFQIALAANNVPVGSTGLTTTLTVEYTPTESDRTESSTITLTAGDVTKTITVSGRSLPDEFLIITKKTLWYALPANMEGAGEHDGVQVIPDDGATPTSVEVSPSTIVYKLSAVASSRYNDAGQCVRLVGYDDLCLWSNKSTTTDKTKIQNKAKLAETNGDNYEWLLTTTDGVRYTIANPNHPEYNEGRRLAYGTKFGLYKEETVFYLVLAGCTTQPQGVVVKPRRTDATFSWESNAGTMTIDLYTNEERTEGHLNVTASSSPYVMTGLAEQTDYWFKLTPASDEACAAYGTFKTTGPTIDVVEWIENGVVIFVDKDEELNPQVVIAGEVEHGVGSGTVATNLFFSKYFEAESNAKLLAIYNGTNNIISLADVTILQRQNGGTSSYTPFSLASLGKIPGYIQPGEEIIMYNEDDSSNKDKIMQCAENDETFPNWYKVNNDNLKFSGKGTVRLFRGGKCIDIIGAMPSPKVEGDIDDITKRPLEGSSKPSFGDDFGFTVTTGDNYTTKNIEETDYELSTNRCLLIRKAFVTSGDSAVLNNFGDFKTLGIYEGVDSKQHKGEWAGLQISTAYDENGKKSYANTCAGFQEVGHFDYNEYYMEMKTLDDSKTLDDYTHDSETKTYTIPIDNLAQYSCLNLEFQLKDPTSQEVITKVPVQVPIIVKGNHSTIDAIFNEIVKTDDATPVPLYDQSIERCKTCDVVVLGEAVLTKATSGSHDVPQVGNIKVYPGGKVVVPEGTTYTVNSLALRRQEDAVSMTDVKGELNVAQDNSVFLDFRIDPSNWHYFSLPFDCNVSDITFSDGLPAALGTDFLLAWYDGAYRAEYKTGGWTDVAPDATLKKGLGYIMAIPGNGKVQREFRFPMANAVIEDEKADKQVDGLYGYGGDKTDEELRPNHKGWNLLGNPYMMPYTSNITEPLATGELIPDPTEIPWAGHYIIDDNTKSLRYFVEPIDNGWSGYRQVTIGAGYEMKPFTSYFVQIGITVPTQPTDAQGVEFSADKKKSSIIRRSPAEYEEDKHPVWCGVVLSAPNKEADETALLISDNFTDGYDMMDDLIKWRGDYYQYYQKPVLASRNTENELAFNALPDNSAKAGVPLNFFAYVQGQYTIALDGRYSLDEVKEVQLFDSELSNWHNLMAEDYTFTAKKGENKTRFTLYVTVERKQPQTPTNVDDLYGKLTLTTADKTLMISGLRDDADIYVYDMSGKLIASDHHVFGEEGVWRTSVATQGVYFVRVMTTNEQQTLNAIVY